MKQCSLCGQLKARTDFDGAAKDCRDCRRTAALRPPRGKAPIERWMNAAGRDARRAISAEAARLSHETGRKHVIDHVVPIRGKIDRRSNDWVLVSGLDVPSNLQVIPVGSNREKWMRFRRADAAAEEARLMNIARNKEPS